MQDYEQLLFQEETLWFQKSREKWVRLGSRNTSFFHAQTVIRRRRNRIHGITLPNGEWCTDANLIKEEAMNYFKTLFSSKETLGTAHRPYNHPRLGVEMASNLAKPVTKEEVYNALMSMKSYKSPGPDGFQPIFFKMFWEDVGDDVCQFVQQAFSTGYLDPHVTETLMVLIPKGDNQVTFKDFRSISLCNVVYKLVTKVLVNRLRPMLPDIVSPLQSSFIPGRGTLDNAVILQEIVYNFRKSKKRKGDVVYKLDLEMAYDRVDWEFLRGTLLLFGFPPVIVSLIMQGITSTSMSLFWNGCRTPTFSPVRGLRQGDPLSPYLFVLCMERLGMMIEEAVTNHAWTPLKLSKDGPQISHLFFADDVLPFAKAKPSQARFISNLLQSFCSFSGLKVSLEKSRAFASKGVTRQRKEKLVGITQIRFTDRIDKYLGFRMLHGRPRNEDFLEIYDKVASKLAAWKGRLLNKPGRTILANAVLTAIPSYSMQMHWFPQHVCDQLDRTVRSFIWSGKQQRGLHLINWKTVTKPRKWGGLSIRGARHQNVALLGKLVWDLLNQSSKLWVNILHAKYVKQNNIFLSRKVKGSPVWRAIMKALDVLESGFSYKIGNGDTSV